MKFQRYLESFKALIWRQLRFVKFQTTKVSAQIFTLFSKKSDSSKTAHIIVMGNKRYGKMALFCAFTFLKRNRTQYGVKIHCDPYNYNLLSRKWLVKKSDIFLCKCLEDDDDPYRKQLEYFGNIQGTYDVLMDADIWWHSILPVESVPITYNKETSDRSKFLVNLVNHLTLLPLNFRKNNLIMITGCFTSWNGFSSGLESKKILELFDQLKSESKILAELKPSELRLIGQIVMSLCFNQLESFKSIIEIEEKSKVPLLSTSFFGATGYFYGQ